MAYQIAAASNFTRIPTLEEVAGMQQTWLHDIFTTHYQVRRQKQFLTEPTPDQEQ